MFTGIIQQLARVQSVQRRSQQVQLGVDLGELAAEVCAGDSVAIDGVCLTATLVQGALVFFDATHESLRSSTLVDLKRGDCVHIERALRADGRLDGHIVQGHVDTVAVLLSRRVGSGATDLRWRVEDPEPALLVKKGSIALAGVSLTVHGLDGAEIEVSLVPFSQGKTRLAELPLGARVNVEYDVLGRYLLRSLQLAKRSPGLDHHFLREHGFA